MRKYLIKIAFFLLPIILVMIPPFLILRDSEENFCSIDDLVQSESKYLIGYAYNESNYKYLKWYNLQVHPKYDVLAIGASRVLQFREEMFTSSFYNAGFSIKSMSDVIPFVETIPKNQLPEVLILGIDQLMFNEASDDLTMTKQSDYWKNAFNKYPNGTVLKGFYTDYLKGKLTYSKVDGVKCIGLNALVNGRGYRRDGSMDYGIQKTRLINSDPKANDFQFQTTKRKMKRGIGGFQHGDKINPKALEKLEEILIYCKMHRIKLLAFLPPMADEIYSAMQKSGHYGYMLGIMDSIQPLFDQYEFEIWNYPNVSSCGSSDEEVLDGLHGGEMCYERLLIDMAKKSNILKDVTDRTQLIVDLNNAIDRYTVYSY